MYNASMKKGAPPKGKPFPFGPKKGDDKSAPVKKGEKPMKPGKKC